MHRPAHFRLSLAVLVLFFASARADDHAGYRVPSPALAAIVDAPLPPVPVLSPDRQTLLMLDRPAAPSIAELAQPELRLAGLRVNPATNGPSRSTFFTGLTFKSFNTGAERRVTGLPAVSRIGDYEWSRDSRHLALTLVVANGIELWLVDIAASAARRLTGPVLNAVLGEPIGWLDETTIIIRRIPPDRGPAPSLATVPQGPVIQENLGRRASARTYNGLLASPHDERLFEHYATSELALVSLDGVLTPLPQRGLVMLAFPSPDTRHVLTQTLHRPYSYLVPFSRFPIAIDVLSREGTREFRLADLPLAENVPPDGVRDGPRSVEWRADAPATLSWIQALPPRQTSADKKPLRDAWHTVAAPFSDKPAELQRFEFRVQSVLWSDDSLALVSETWARTGVTRLWRVAPGDPGGGRTLLFERKTEDRYGDPGRVSTGRNALGRL
ncbi:MAG: S9 family peptidase, partial [Opitutaceae bacterium]